MSDSRQYTRPRKACRRSGVAIVMVLGLLSITFAVAYSMMRVQASAERLKTNANLDVLARQAATTGFSTGLRKMHESAWAGVGTTLSANLAANQSYTLSYVSGDSTLASNHAKQPWRVTLLVTGKAIDPARPSVSAQHSIRAIVELNARNTPTNPTVFTNALQYTAYQYANDSFELQYPCQITGTVRLMGEMIVGNVYPNTSSQQNRYMSDLNAMRSNIGDFRPLQGPVYLPTSRTPSTMRTNVSSRLGVTLNNISTDTVTWAYPGVVTSYKLYPGGKSYTAVQCASFLQNTTLSPDNATNPLGLFYRNGSVQVCDNVTINGTLICNDLTICGHPATFNAVSMPSLEDSTTPVQLPAIVSGDDVVIESGATVTIRGAVSVCDDFDVQAGSTSTTLDMQGRLLTKGLFFRARNEWNFSSSIWAALYIAFQNQLDNSNPNPYFPSYLAGFGLNPTPLLTVKPETSPVRYVWKDLTNTVYTPGSSDPGLRWNVVDLNDHYNPTGG